MNSSVRHMAEGKYDANCKSKERESQAMTNAALYRTISGTILVAVLAMSAEGEAEAGVVPAQTVVLGAKDAGRVIDGGGREISGGYAVDGRTLAEEMKAVLPPSARGVAVAAGSLDEHPDADCAVFGFLPRREWLGKSPSFLRDKAREAERDAFCAGFVAKLEGLLDSASKKGMTCVVLTPFPIDEYTPGPDGAEYGDYGNSLWLGSARQAMEGLIGVFGTSRAASVDVYMIISRRLAAGEQGLVLPDRVTPTSLALRLAALEAVGVMFRDADDLRFYR